MEILLDEMEEKEIIQGLNYAYEKINKEFKTFQYIKTVIMRNELVEKEEIEIVKEVEKEEKEILINQVNLEDGEFNPSVELEKEILKYAKEYENVDFDFLNKMKSKSLKIYISVLKNYYEKMKNKGEKI